MFSLHVTGIQFSATSPKENNSGSLFRQRRFRFRCTFLDTVIVHPTVLQENELFTVPHLLRDYAIIIHAIRDKSLQSNTKVLFELIDEAYPDDHFVVWEISIASILFGPSKMMISHSNTQNEDIVYSIRFRNMSSRVNDYCMIIGSITISNVPSSSYSYLFSSNSIDCVSSKSIRIQNDDYKLSLPGFPKVYLSSVGNTNFSFQLFNSEHKKILFSLSGEALLSRILLPNCTFPMTCLTDSFVCTLSFEVIPSMIVSSCEQSLQYQIENTITDSCTMTEELIPIMIDDSSIILPHSSLFLSISEEGYGFKKNQSLVMFIPFATIEHSEVKSMNSIGRGFSTGEIEMVFNQREKIYSDWIRFKMTYLENHSIWSLIKCIPQLIEHRQYRFFRRIQPIWTELVNIKKNSVFLNTVTGRVVSSIPKESQASITFSCIEEIRPIDLVKVNWNDDKSFIMIKSVNDDSLRRKVSSGYILVRILFYKDKKWIELNHDVIDDVSSRIQKPQSYPLKICFSNPYC